MKLARKLFCRPHQMRFGVVKVVRQMLFDLWNELTIIRFELDRSECGY